MVIHAVMLVLCFGVSLGGALASADMEHKAATPESTLRHGLRQGPAGCIA